MTPRSDLGSSKVDARPCKYLFILPGDCWGLQCLQLNWKRAVYKISKVYKTKVYIPGLVITLTTRRRSFLAIEQQGKEPQCSRRLQSCWRSSAGGRGIFCLHTIFVFRCIWSQHTPFCFIGPKCCFFVRRNLQTNIINVDILIVLKILRNSPQ